MKDLFSKQMEQEYFDEQFMQDAAKQIDRVLLEELRASQFLDPDEEWLTNLEMRSVKSVRLKKNIRHVRTILKRSGQIAAIFFLTICILFSTVYFTVDAARETINNFFLGKTNKVNTVVIPNYLDAEDYALIPYKWSGPVFPTWIPNGYRLFDSGTLEDQHWWLVYHPEETINRSICFYIWDNNYTPAIDIESYAVVSEYDIQDVPATIYHDPKHDFHTLIMVKNDITIQIIGTIGSSEVSQIAERLVF